MKKYGLASPYRDKHAAKGGIQREQLEPLVEEGMTIAEIANEVGLSKGTVRHRMGKYSLRTHNPARRRCREVARAGKAAGLLTVTMFCRHHGETEFYLEGRGYYRCKQCRSAAVGRGRRRMKELLIAEAGGRCRICGYDRYPCALEFHHLDPTEKRMTVSARGIAYALETLRLEAEKCVLLCANCHAEVENGRASVPIK